MQLPIVRRVLDRIREALRGEDGQDLLEYGMLAALIALVALGAVTSVGNIIHTAFWQTIGVASANF